MRFILKMAWRDSRRNRARLLLFISAVVVGIAALTGVRSFSYNLTKDIDREAKTLLAADLRIQGNLPMPDSMMSQIMEVPGIERARVYNLMSMVYFPKTDDTRLAMVRAAEPGYPFFGEWASEPGPAWKEYHNGKSSLLEHALVLQYGVDPGDSVRIGNQFFEVEGDLLSRPGRAGIGSSIAPIAFIPFNWLDSTGLVKTGSRVFYQYYFKIPDIEDLNALVEELEEPMEGAQLEWETVETNKESIGSALSGVTTFLNLVGFIALLLGCIGVAGAVHLYIKSKLSTVAILRCLGASGRKAFMIYLVQVAGIGLFGAVVGAVAGLLIQQALPWVAQDLLPVQEVSTDISWAAAGQGVLLGLCVAILFALLPLSGILSTSPLRTLRASVEKNERKAGRLLRWSVYALIAVSILGFTWWLTGTLRDTLFFVGGVGLAFAVLWGLAALLTFLLRRFFPRKWSYVWRQAIANLFRPQNQTVLLVVTIGLGTMLLSTLFLIQTLLLQQVAFSANEDQPNMILFDIQTSEKDSVAALVREKNLPVIQQVPIVTIRLDQVRDVTKAEAKADTTVKISDWVWDREYRVTFRDSVIDSETITEGSWTGQYDGDGPVPISISENLQRGLKAEVGDQMFFDVQGVPLQVEIGSIRKVDFRRFQTNFMVVFPNGVLEKAPQFHVLISRVENAEQSAAIQSALVKKFPTISAIDITQILKSLETVLAKVSFVIRFMALFSILTGLLVLLSSIYQSKFARVRESVLLRTLGASRSQILRINALEYMLLGTLACLAGIGLSLAGGWALARYVFEIPFSFQWLPLLITFVIITGLTVSLGLLNSREVVRKPPLEVLRAEV